MNRPFFGVVTATALIGLGGCSPAATTPSPHAAVQADSCGSLVDGIPPIDDTTREAEHDHSSHHRSIPFPPLAIDASFSPDDKYVLVTFDQEADRSGNFRWQALLDARTGEQLCRVPDQGKAAPFAFLPGGTEMLVPEGGGKDEDELLNVWRLPDGQAVRGFERKETAVCRLAISPDGLLALSANEDGGLLAWDVRTGKLVRVFDAPRREMASTAFWATRLFFSSDGKEAFSAYSQTIKVWDVSTGKQITRPFAEYENSPGHRLMGRSADGRFICSGCALLEWKQPAVKVFDVTNGKMVGSFFGHPTERDQLNYIVNAGLTADARYAYSVASYGPLRQWEVSTGREVWALDLCHARVMGAGFSDDGALAFVGQADGSVRVWDLDRRKELWNLDLSKHKDYWKLKASGN